MDCKRLQKNAEALLRYIEDYNVCDEIANDDGNCDVWRSVEFEALLDALRPDLQDEESYSP